MSEMRPLGVPVLVGPVEHTILALEGSRPLVRRSREVCRHGPGEVSAVDVWLLQNPGSLRALHEGEQGVSAPGALKEAVVSESLVAGAHGGLASLLARTVALTVLVPA